MKKFKNWIIKFICWLFMPFLLLNRKKIKPWIEHDSPEKLQGICLFTHQDVVRNVIKSSIPEEFYSIDKYTNILSKTIDYMTYELACEALYGMETVLNCHKYDREIISSEEFNKRQDQILYINKHLLNNYTILINGLDEKNKRALLLFHH